MSELSKQALKVENNTNFPNNNTGYITPALLREFNTDMIDSLVDEIGYTSDSASWNSQIGLSLTTASFSGNTLTFTKGNGVTFGIVLPDVSGSTLPSGTISGSGQITALGFVSSSVTASSIVTA